MGAVRLHSQCFAALAAWRAGYSPHYWARWPDHCAYYSGAKLGGVIIVEPLFAFTALSIGWAVFMPLLMKLSVYFDGIGTARTTAGARHYA